MIDDFNDPKLESDFQQAFAAPAPVAPAPVAAPAPVSDEPVNVFTPEGELVSIPHNQLGDAINFGYRAASDEDMRQHELQQTHGGLGEQIKTGLEGAAEAATFGASVAAERALGVKPEDIQARREANPASHMVGQMAGLAGSMFTGVGEAALLERAGVAGAKALGLGAAETTLGKIGSAAVKGAIENAAFQAGDENAKLLSQDPNQSVQTAITDIGLSGLIGGGIAGGFGSVNPLWQATMGTKVGGMLKGMANKFGGIEGEAIAKTATDEILQKAGLDVAPEIRASVSNVPELQQVAKTLAIADNASGEAWRTAHASAMQQATDILPRALGKDPATIPSEISTHAHGTNIGETLADEIAAQTAPISKGFEELRAKLPEIDLHDKVKMVEIEKSQQKDLAAMLKAQEEVQKALNAGNPEAAIEASARLEAIQNKVSSAVSDVNSLRVKDSIIDEVSKLADRENWSTSQSSKIMREVKRVIREVPDLKTLGNLTGYIEQVGHNMYDPLDRSLNRAGMMVKDILRKHESDIIAKSLGEVEGPEAVAKFAELREAYRAQSQLKDMVDSRLGAKGSTSRYAEAVREMTKADAESVLRRLSGSGDAEWLNIVQQRFPNTAAAIKQYHVDNVLAKAAGKAKEGMSVDPKTLLKSLSSMSPELRDFAIGKEAASKIEAVGGILEKLGSLTQGRSVANASVDKLLAHVPGSAVATVSGMLGIHPGVAGLLGYATKALTKDIPDAVRLAMLKFMGSTSPVDAGGFKAMAEFFNHTIKGEKTIVKATSSVFKAGREVLPQSMFPSEKDRERLDKQLKALQTDPSGLFEVGGKTGHYMPEHGVALGQTAANAVNFVNSQRPSTDKSAPLDSKPVLNPGQKATFERILNIAQQPLVCLPKIKDGSITPHEVLAVKTMYPDLYNRLSQDLTNNMTDTLTKGESIPYSTRMGLSAFLGQALDSTMTPMGIQAAQPKPQGNQEQTPTQTTQRPKHSMAALNKLPGAYQTPGQARQAKQVRD